MRNRINGIFSDKISFFNDNELAKFRHICYPKGSMIYAQKKLFMIILKGKGKLNTYHENSREYVLSYFKAGSFVLIDTFLSFEVTQDLEVLEANLSTVIKLSRANDKFANYLFNSFLKHTTMLKSVIKELVFDSVEDRTYKFLLSVADKNMIYLKGGVSQISAFVGASRQNVSLAITKLIKAKKIKKIDNSNFQILA